MLDNPCVYEFQISDSEAKYYTRAGFYAEYVFAGQAFILNGLDLASAWNVTYLRTDELYLFNTTFSGGNNRFWLVFIPD